MSKIGDFHFLKDHSIENVWEKGRGRSKEPRQDAIAIIQGRDVTSDQNGRVGSGGKGTV